VVRSKGFFWLATRGEHVGNWSQAGLSLRIEPAGLWWIAAPDEFWPGEDEPEERQAILARFEGPYGDRRQEIVFIGRGMDEAELRERLDECLLTDAEFEAGPELWAHLSDPFAPWIPVADEADGEACAIPGNDAIDSPEAARLLSRQSESTAQGRES